MESSKSNRVAILDGDAHYREILGQYCQELGYLEIAEYSSTDTLAAALETESFDLFLIDWGMQGTVTGAGLANQIRQNQKFLLTPLVLFSGVLKDSDLTLTEEFFCTQFMQKPVMKDQFIHILKELKKEYAWYKENYKHLNQAIQKGCLKSASSELILALLDKAPNPVPLGLLLSDILLEKNRYSECEIIQKKILSIDSQNIRALQNLGKICYETEDMENAYRYLKAADKLSPDNLMRICTLGQIELKNLNGSAASETFARGLEIDGKNQESMQGLQVAKNLDEFLTLRPLSIAKPFACVMNSIGVYKVQEGEIDEGIEHYKSALSFIVCRTNRTKVMFNIGFGYFRNQDYENAVEWLERSFSESSQRFAKARTYAMLIRNKVEIIEDTDLIAIEQQSEMSMEDMYEAISSAS